MDTLLTLSLPLQLLLPLKLRKKTMGSLRLAVVDGQEGSAATSVGRTEADSEADSEEIADSEAGETAGVVVGDLSMKRPSLILFCPLLGYRGRGSGEWRGDGERGRGGRGRGGRGLDRGGGSPSFVLLIALLTFKARPSMTIPAKKTERAV
jgi:hypothetical protein